MSVLAHCQISRILSNSVACDARQESVMPVGVDVLTINSEEALPISRCSHVPQSPNHEPGVKQRCIHSSKGKGRWPYRSHRPISLSRRYFCSVCRIGTIWASTMEPRPIMIGWSCLNGSTSSLMPSLANLENRPVSGIHDAFSITISSG